jgi:hypothetical protein
MSYEMAHALKDGPLPRARCWGRAGEKCGSEALAAKPFVNVQQMPGCSYKYMHVATVETGQGQLAYYEHAAKKPVGGKQPGLVFRSAGTLYVKIDAVGVNSRRGSIQLRAKYAMSGNELCEISIPEAANLAHLRQDLQRLLVFHEHCTDQTKLVIVPNDDHVLMSGCAKVKKVFGEQLQVIKQQQPDADQRTIKRYLKKKVNV